MTALRRRLSALEKAMMHDLSPAVKAWLGHTLSADERQHLDEDAGSAWNADEIDTSEWSAEMKQWLGVN